MQKFIKKMKKGFTIMELVIVIAVIAILAAVLIPTFSNITENANESAAMQECRNEWTNYTVEIATSSTEFNADYVVVYAPADADAEDYYYFEVTGGQFDPTAVEGKYTYTSNETPALTATGITAEAAKCEDGTTAYDPENDNIQIFKVSSES